jgi:hypothetical protein
MSRRRAGLDRTSATTSGGGVELVAAIVREGGA